MNNDEQMTTAELYEYEKARVTLRFLHRSNMYREKLSSVRQTQFPLYIENDEPFLTDYFGAMQ